MVGTRLLNKPKGLICLTSDSLSDSWLEDCFKTSCTSEYQLPDVAPAGIDESGSVRITGAVGERTNQRRTPSKPHSTPLTLKWLDDNYEIVEGVCIPRSTLYVHYLDFCEKNDCQPVNAASFGKIIRQQFPQITTRRLGTRGQSKYHYYGVGVKESSPYYDVIYSSKGVQNSADGKKDTTKQVIAYSPRSKLGTLLPEFPNVSDLKLPPDIPQEKVVTFLMMYRTHCQRILDTVIRANFDEVQSFLLHFWQGMPQHMVPILGSACITNLVGVCDSILYKAISGVLMPTVLQALPESLTQVIKKFAKQLRDWINAALEGLPQTLNNMKSTLATTFAQSLRRQTSLNHLCQASRTVVHSGDITAQMLEDWYSVDINSVCKQTLYTMQDYNSKDYGLITSLCKEFENLMEDQEPIELYTEWLDRMIDTCVIQMASEKQPGSVKQKARQFLLTWSFFGTRIIRELTLHSAPSFGSFHLLHLMFDDYVMYRVESLCSQETANQLLMAAKGEKTNVITEEVILPNPSITLSSPSAFDASLSTPALPTSSLDDHCRTSCSIGYESSNNILTSPLASVQQHFDGSLQMVNNISLEMHDSPCTPSSYGVDSFCRSNNSLSIQEPVFNSYGFNGSQFSAIPPYNNCLRRTDSNHWAMTSQPAFQTAIQNTTPDIGSYEYSAFTNFTRPHNPETYQAFTESSPFYDVSSGKRPIESVNESDGTRVQSTDSTYTPLPHSYQLS